MAVPHALSDLFESLRRSTPNGELKFLAPEVQTLYDVWQADKLGIAAPSRIERALGIIHRAPDAWNPFVEVGLQQGDTVLVLKYQLCAWGWQQVI